jgi:hypothetical protein
MLDPQELGRTMEHLGQAEALDEVAHLMGHKDTADWMDAEGVETTEELLAKLHENPIRELEEVRPSDPPTPHRPEFNDPHQAAIDALKRQRESDTEFPDEIDQSDLERELRLCRLAEEARIKRLEGAAAVASDELVSPAELARSKLDDEGRLADILKAGK